MQTPKDRLRLLVTRAVLGVGVLLVIAGIVAAFTRSSDFACAFWAPGLALLTGAMTSVLDRH